MDFDYKYPEFLTEPAKKEYFTRFISLKSRDRDGTAVCINLHPKNSNINSKEEVVLYCDKVKVDETLKEAVNRCLWDDFGLKMISYHHRLDVIDLAKNKFGESLPRIGINAYVEYSPLENKEVVGCQAEWISRKKYPLTKGEMDVLDWLEIDDHELASNRFTKEEVITFVKNLYTQGAMDVFMDLLEPDESYCDSLEIILPANPGQRQKLFTLYNEELKHEFPEAKEETDIMQDSLNLWWD
ncbi:MAG: hypothetical protein WC503_01475 [Candidatus Shapirobacteria bacterium]